MPPPHLCFCFNCHLKNCSYFTSAKCSFWNTCEQKSSLAVMLVFLALKATPFFFWNSSALKNHCLARKITKPFSQLEAGASASEGRYGFCFFSHFERVWEAGGDPGKKKKKKAVSGFCSAAFRIFFPTKKQPDDLLMIHLELLFVPEGACRLVEMNRLLRFSFACAVVWSVWLCIVLGRQFLIE